MLRASWKNSRISVWDSIVTPTCQRHVLHKMVHIAWFGGRRMEVGRGRTCMPPLETTTDSPGETPELPQDPCQHWRGILRFWTLPCCFLQRQIILLLGWVEFHFAIISQHICLFYYRKTFGLFPIWGYHELCFCEYSLNCEWSLKTFWGPLCTHSCWICT